jgi:hypothetical protein
VHNGGREAKRALEANRAGNGREEILADSGYCSEENLKALDSAENPERRIEGYVAMKPSEPSTMRDSGSVKLIVGQTVTAASNDKEQLMPMVDVEHDSRDKYKGS